MSELRQVHPITTRSCASTRSARRYRSPKLRAPASRQWGSLAAPQEPSASSPGRTGSRSPKHPFDDGDSFARDPCRSANLVDVPTTSRQQQVGPDADNAQGTRGPTALAHQSPTIVNPARDDFLVAEGQRADTERSKRRRPRQVQPDFRTENRLVRAARAVVLRASSAGNRTLWALMARAAATWCARRSLTAGSFSYAESGGSVGCGFGDMTLSAGTVAVAVAVAGDGETAKACVRTGDTGTAAAGLLTLPPHAEAVTSSTPPRHRSARLRSVACR